MCPCSLHIWIMAFGIRRESIKTASAPLTCWHFREQRFLSARCWTSSSPIVCRYLCSWFPGISSSTSASVTTVNKYSCRQDVGLVRPPSFAVVFCSWLTGFWSFTSPYFHFFWFLSSKCLSNVLHRILTWYYERNTKYTFERFSIMDALRLPPPGQQ